MYHMEGALPSGFTSSVHTITTDLYPSDPIVPFTSKQPKSLLDVFSKADDFDEFVKMVFDHPWVALVWFNF